MVLSQWLQRSLCRNGSFWPCVEAPSFPQQSCCRCTAAWATRLRLPLPHTQQTPAAKTTMAITEAMILWLMYRTLIIIPLTLLIVAQNPSKVELFCVSINAEAFKAGIRAIYGSF